MARISINLLPQEFKIEQIRKSKFYKIQAIGIATILVFIFLSSLTVALRILQSQKITRIQNQVAGFEAKVSELKNTQASLLLLKNRLNTISKHFETPSKQSQMYKLVADLLPSSAVISGISVSEDGQVTVSAIINDISSLDTMMTNLTNKETNLDKIREVSLESLNRGKDGVYKLSFQIKPK